MIQSWKDAEYAAAEHMRRLGWRDAMLTQGGADGGVDVTASDAAAQVKFLSKPVGSPDVQRLRGAAHTYRHALFYSGSGYTSQAMDAAEQSDVALFLFTPDGLAVALNSAAVALTARPEADATLIAELQQISASNSESMLVLPSMESAIRETMKSRALAVQSQANRLKETRGSREDVERLEAVYHAIVADVTVVQEINSIYLAFPEQGGPIIDAQDVLGFFQLCERTKASMTEAAERLSFDKSEWGPLFEQRLEERRAARDAMIVEGEDEEQAFPDLLDVYRERKAAGS